MPDATPFALFRNVFVKMSETFIHDELRFHVRYQPTVFVHRHVNADVFPGHEVVRAARGPLGEYSPLSLLYAATGFYPPFYEEFARRRFAFVHVHFGHNGFTGFPVAERFHLPLIVTLHGADVTKLIGSERYNPLWWHYTLRKNELFRKTTLFLAASTELRQLVIEAGCPEEKVVVHTLGIDLGKFVPRETEPDGTPQLLMVGRLVEKKGFAYGLRAFAGVRAANVAARLAILGDGPLRADLEALARRLGVADEVRFLGVRPPAEVAAEMGRSAALIAPSIVVANMDRESGLIVAKEASATGIPVVGHVHGGLPAIVDSGTTGYLVPERDVDGMAARLVQLLRDPALRRELGAAARRKMEREYDIRRKNEALENIYDRVVAGDVRSLL